MSPVYQPPASSGGGAVATDVIWDTKGDLAAATGADAAVKVAVGADGLVLTADAASTAGVKWASVASGTLSSSSAYLSADVTMTTAGTYYDSAALTLSAGSYLLIGSVDVLAVTAASRTWDAKLWDGTTKISQAQHTVPGSAAAGTVSLVIAGVVTPGGSTTYKISITSTVNGDHIQGGAPQDKASYLIALKFA